MPSRATITVLLTLAIAALAGCGGSGSLSTAASPAGRKKAVQQAPPPRPLKLHVKSASIQLPAPVSGETVVPEGKSILVIGGLDGSDVSVASVLRLDPGSGRTSLAGSLSQPLHDAAAAALPGGVLVFGGGSAATIDEVERLVPGGSGEVVGRLPVAASDLTAVTVGGRAYVLGGYDGQETVGAILQTRDGAHLKVVGQLPVAVRYPAVVADGPTIYAFGGEESSGADSSAIQAFDTRTGRAMVVGHLAGTLAHASAIDLGGRIFILGGRLDGSTTDRILRFDPPHGTAVPVGHLPEAIQNAAATVLGGTGYLIGGLTAGESPVASIVTLGMAPASG